MVVGSLRFLEHFYPQQIGMFHDPFWHSFFFEWVGSTTQVYNQGSPPKVELIQWKKQHGFIIQVEARH